MCRVRACFVLSVRPHCSHIVDLTSEINSISIIISLQFPQKVGKKYFNRSDFRMILMVELTVQ